MAQREEGKKLLFGFGIGLASAALPAPRRHRSRAGVATTTESIGNSWRGDASRKDFSDGLILLGSQGKFVRSVGEQQS